MPRVEFQLRHRPSFELEYTDDEFDALTKGDLAHDANQALADRMMNGGYEATEWKRVEDNDNGDEDSKPLRQKAFADLDAIAVEAELALAALARGDEDAAREQLESIKGKADPWEA